MKAQPVRRGSRLLVVLGVATLASLGANVLLARSSQRYLEQANDVRLDPAGLKVYAAERAVPRCADTRRGATPAASDRKVLAFLGDSRAVMWPPPTLPGYEIKNVGVGNQTTAQVLLRFDADVPRLRPSVVVLEVGVNDLKTIADFPQRRASIVADCERNIAGVVAKSRALGATVVLATIFGIGDVALVRRPFWSDEVSVAVREVNRHLRGLAADRVMILDADPLLADDSGKIRAPYQLDFLHLAPAGYAALNEGLGPLVGTMTASAN